MHLCLILQNTTDVRLIEGLAERFTLTVLCRQLDREPINHPPTTDVSIVTGPGSRGLFAGFVLRYLLRRRQSFDAVISQGYGPISFAANLASRLASIRTYLLICSPSEAYYRCRRFNLDSDRPYRPHELLVIRLFGKLNALVGSRYIVLSQHLADVVKNHGARGEMHHISLYGVDTTKFTPPTAPKAQLRRAEGLPEHGSIIFFSSRVAPEKDSRTLLEVFHRLRGRGRDVWLLHRSGGYRRFQQEAEKRGFADRLIATDAVHPQNQLPRDYQVSDVCVQSSWEEGLGFSPLEALACGTPVVASAVDGMRETMIPGQTGWTYDPGDPDGLLQCLEEVLDHPNIAAERTVRGREMVRDRYDQKVVFDHLESVMRSEVTNNAPTKS